MNVEVVRNDYGYDLEFVIKDVNKDLVDLTSSTITFKVTEPGGTSNKLNGAVTITDATAGECKYTVVNGDFDEAKTYNAELQIVYSGKTITVAGITLKVIKDLPTT